MPLAQDCRCLVAAFLPFHRAISLFSADRAGQPRIISLDMSMHLKISAVVCEWMQMQMR